MKVAGLTEIIIIVVSGGLCLLVTAAVIALIVWLVARSRKDGEGPGG